MSRTAPLPPRARPLPDADAEQLVAEIVRIVGQISTAVPAARGRLRGWQGGPLRSTPTDGAGGRAGGTHADPTYDAVQGGGSVDEAADRLAALDVLTVQLRTLCCDLHDGALRTMDSRAPADLNQGCDLCGQYGKTVPALREQIRAEGDKRARPRCRWHTDVLKTYGQDLHPAINRLRHDYPDLRITSPAFVRALREHHFDLWSKHHVGVTGRGVAWRDKTA